MAGTDHRRQAVTGGPAIILVEPQLGENIGTAARAMMNCGLDDLRLVRPRDGWPSDKAIGAASGADAVLAKARLYPTVPAALADLVHVYATTVRDRGMVRRVVTPSRAAEEMRVWLAAGEACVSELAEEEGEKITTVSARLKALHTVRLVKRRREAKHVFYSLADEHVLPLVHNAIDHAAEGRTAMSADPEVRKDDNR